MDRLSAMETFVHVVETGSFSAAAKRLGIGQPAVSKSIAQLEARLAVRLLLLRRTRHPGGFAATPGDHLHPWRRLALELHPRRHAPPHRRPRSPARHRSRRCPRRRAQPYGTDPVIHLDVRPGAGQWRGQDRADRLEVAAQGPMGGVPHRTHGECESAGVRGVCGRVTGLAPNTPSRFACACLDWSMRRPHLSGALGAAFLQGAIRREWVTQDLDSRALGITPKRRKALAGRFGIQAAGHGSRRLQGHVVFR